MAAAAGDGSRRERARRCTTGDGGSPTDSAKRINGARGDAAAAGLVVAAAAAAPRRSLRSGGVAVLQLSQAVHSLRKGGAAAPCCGPLRVALQLEE